jgi:chemotaxis signal transduction protein
MEKLLNLDHATASSFDLLQLDPLPLETRQRLLRFSLSEQDDALLPLEQMAEIFNINPAYILPVPEMPSCVLGICNWRGEMLWLIDLNDLVGYPSCFQQQLPASVTVMVVRANHHCVGIAVQQIKDIELHNLQQLQPTVSRLFPQGLLPLVLGALPDCCIAVLDIQAIAQYPLWKIHQEKGA